MTALPPKANLTGATVTQGQFKTALDTVNDYLTGLLGSDGTPATARAALGVINATAPTSAQVISALGFTPYSTTSAVGKVDRTGDTMTGNLTMSGSANVVSSRGGDDARNTGFKMADGQDLGEMNRSNQYYDDRASNCNGYLSNGNCSGNAQWTPPNGNWWEWYSGRASQGAWTNNGAFDGAGGTTYAYNAVSVGFNYDAYYLGVDEIGGGEYHRNYRNCNCGAFNCRTNCNCDCNCNCGC